MNMLYKHLPKLLKLYNYFNLRVIYKYVPKSIRNKINLFLFPIVSKAPKQKYIFIHINKTGGTSINKALGLKGRRHFTVSEIIQKIGKNKVSSCFVFVVVRNPWAKVVSHYNYRIKTNQTSMRDNSISFTKWVQQTYGPKKNRFYYNNPKMFLPQSEWIKDENGNILIDKIIRFENLNDDFLEMTKFLGFKNISLPKINKTKKVDYRDYYNDRTKKIIEEWFSEDIRLFNYSFDK